MVPGTNGNYPMSNENSLTGRAELLWKPVDTWTFELWGEHYQDNSHGDALKNVLDDNPDPRQISQDFRSIDQAQNDLAALNANGDLSWSTAKFVASYQYGKLNNPEDVDKLDFSQAVALYGIHDVYPVNMHVGHSYTQEFDLTSKPGGSLDWIAGLFAMQQSYRDTYLEYQYATPGLVLPTDMGDPAAIFATGSLGFEAVDKQVLESEAAYAQATYHFTDTLRFTGGVRDTIGRQAGYDATFFAAPVELHKSFNGVTGRAGIEYDLTPTNLVYATWASGMKPGGTNLNPDSEYVPKEFQPETNKTVELGSKNEFLDKTLRVNADVFYSIYGDYQIDSEDPLPYENGLVNVGSIHTYGFEGEFNAILPKGFQLDAAISSMGGRVQTHNLVFDPLQAQSINKADGGPYVGTDVADRTAAYFSSNSDVYGKTPPDLAPFSGGLTIRNEQDVFGGRLTSQVNFTYRLGYWARIFNNPATDKVPNLSQWGLSFSYEPTAGSWYVDFLITNLLNADSVSTRFADIYGVGEVANYYVPPRQFIGRVGYRF
jgi:iron complex outermembrane recepter protein